MRASRPTAQVIPHAESDDVVEGLLAPRKRLPCRLLYDARGAELFEQICTLPEYYPTRVEKALLRAHLPAVAAAVGPGARIIEPGSGAGEKTRMLLTALAQPAVYVPIDVSAEQLVYLSHWTTPEGAKKRFATWFFLTILEDGQEVRVDGGEIAQHRWVRPETAICESADEAHPLRLMPPTYVSLADIADCHSCAQARERIGQRDAIIYAPRMVAVADGMCFLYEGDAGYQDTSVEAQGARHRLYMIKSQLEYLRQT